VGTCGAVTNNGSLVAGSEIAGKRNRNARHTRKGSQRRLVVLEVLVVLGAPPNLLFVSHSLRKCSPVSAQLYSPLRVLDATSPQGDS